jgi:hypothetical protein
VTRVAVLPHRCAAHGVVATPWRLRSGGRAISSVELLASEAGRTAIEIESQVTVDPITIRAQCGLDPAAPLVLISTWYSLGTNTRELIARVPLERAETQRASVVDSAFVVEMSFVIDAIQVAGEVVLDRRVVLDREHPSNDPLVASAAGSILWRESPADQLVLRLGDATGQLAIEVIDFETRPDLDTAAAWALEVHTDQLDAVGRSALRLSVNVSHPAIAELVGRDDHRREQVASVLRWDVARRLLDALLDDGRFVEGAGGFAPGSIGGLGQSMIERRWPDDTPRTLRDRRLVSRAAFETEVQARVGLLRST